MKKLGKGVGKRSGLNKSGSDKAHPPVSGTAGRTGIGGTCTMESLKGGGRLFKKG
jgi:hypothetical protein